MNGELDFLDFDEKFEEIEEKSNSSSEMNEEVNNNENLDSDEKSVLKNEPNNEIVNQKAPPILYDKNLDIEELNQMMNINSLINPESLLNYKKDENNNVIHLQPIKNDGKSPQTNSDPKSISSPIKRFRSKVIQVMAFNKKKLIAKNSKNQDSIKDVNNAVAIVSTNKMNNENTSCDIKDDNNIIQSPPRDEKNHLTINQNNEMHDTQNENEGLHSDEDVFQKSKFNKMKTTYDSKLRQNPQFSMLRMIILPDDTIKGFWNIVMIISMLYSIILMPLILAYADNSPLSGWQITDNIIDIFFFIDIILNFFTAYFDEDENLIVNRKKIAMNYLTGWFIFDLSSITPFDFIFPGLDINLGSLIRLTRTPRLYSLIKVEKLINLLKSSNNAIIDKVNIAISTKSRTQRLIITALNMLLVVHVATCLWHILVTSTPRDDNNWLVRFNFIHFQVIDIYIAEFYLVVQTITTVGYGDLNPSTPFERLFGTALMFIGAFIYSFITGSLASVLSDSSSNQTKINKKMTVLLDLKKSFGLNDKLFAECSKAIKYGKRDFSDFKTFVKELPENLRIELTYVMHSDIIKNFYFFKNQPKSLIAYIGPLLKPIKVSKGEHIYFAGDLAEEMFFIKSGQVAFVIEEFKNFPFLKIKEGYYFGEIDLLLNGEIRNFTAKAIKDCEIFVLNKKYFKNVFFVEFRHLGEQIFKNAYIRKLRNKTIYKKAYKYCLTKYPKPPKTNAKGLSLPNQMNSLDDSSDDQISLQNSPKNTDDKNFDNQKESEIDEEEEYEEGKDLKEPKDNEAKSKMIPTKNLFEADFQTKVEKKHFEHGQRHSKTWIGSSTNLPDFPLKGQKSHLKTLINNVSETDISTKEAKFLNSRIDGLEERINKMLGVYRSMKRQNVFLCNHPDHQKHALNKEVQAISIDHPNATCSTKKNEKSHKFASHSMKLAHKEKSNDFDVRILNHASKTYIGDYTSDLITDLGKKINKIKGISDIKADNFDYVVGIELSNHEINENDSSSYNNDNNSSSNSNSRSND